MNKGPFASPQTQRHRFAGRVDRHRPAGLGHSA